MNTTTWNADFAAYAEMRILIVDDEPANVALLEDMLSDQSYVQVKSTTDSREVVELCEEYLALLRREFEVLEKASQPTPP